MIAAKYETNAMLYRLKQSGRLSHLHYSSSCFIRRGACYIYRNLKTNICGTFLFHLVRTYRMPSCSRRRRSIRPGTPSVLVRHPGSRSPSGTPSTSSCHRGSTVPPDTAPSSPRLEEGPGSTTRQGKACTWTRLRQSTLRPNTRSVSPTV